MVDYIKIFFRVVTILPILLFTTIYVMGKRSIGEMPVFDFLTLVIMGAVVGADIADPNIEHLPTVYTIFLIALLQHLISKYSLKYRKLGKLVNFEPTLIMQNGKFLVTNLKRVKYTIDDVLMMLREKEVFDFKEVHYAIIEANGNISVLKKADVKPVTPKEMGIEVKDQEVPAIVILEGKIDKTGIEKANLTEEKVMALINEQGYKKLTDIFVATYTKKDGLYISPYHVDKGNVYMEH